MKGINTSFFLCSILVLLKAVSSEYSVATEVLDYYDSNFDDFQSQVGTIDKEIVLVLGNYGPTKVQAFAVRIDAIIGEEIEKTDYGATIAELVDKKSNNKYIVYPGFKEYRQPKEDLSINYIVWKLLKSTVSVKFVFTIAFASYPPSIADRYDFLEVAKSAVKLIKNIEKYRDSIALVVTKIQNRLDDDGADVERLIDQTADLLKQAKRTLENETRSDQDDQGQQLQIKFIDILLEKKNEEYTKITVFRLSDNDTQLDISTIEHDKAAFLKIVDTNLVFVRRNESDFGHTLSYESLNVFDNITEETSKRFADNVNVIADGLQKSFLKQEKHSLDLKMLNESMVLGYNKLTRLNSSQALVFITELVIVADQYSTESYQNVLNLLKYVQFIDFLMHANGCDSSAFHFARGLTNTINYLKSSAEWYKYLIDLQDKLTQYDVQNRTTQYRASKLLKQCRLIAEKETEFIDESTLKAIFSEVDILSYNLTAESGIDSVKLNALCRVWRKNIQSADVSCESKKLVVKGYNILMSDVVNLPCLSNLMPNSTIDIFALHIVFVDADFDMKGKHVQLAVIAPIWEIILNDGAKERTISLNGEEPVKLAPAESDHDNEGASDGKAGKHGGPGGNFFGIGNNFVNDQQLKIFVNGGTGGAGQDGGRGMNATDGIQPKDPSIWESVELLFRFRPKIEYTPGRNATDGGHGGCAGIGGIRGKSIVIGLQTSPNISVFSRDGENGEPGRGGEGGTAATNGAYCKMATYFNIMNIRNGNTRFLRNDLRYYRSCARIDPIPAGKTGTNGKCCDERTSPDANHYPNPSSSINAYKTYAMAYWASNNYSTRFLEELNRDKNVSALYDVIDFIEEFESLEKMYFQFRKRLHFNPFYKSLHNRIGDHIDTLENSTYENKKILTFLYIEASNKTSYQRNRTVVVNLVQYLNVVQRHIIEWQKKDKEAYINSYRDEYKESFDYKIDSANLLIETLIVPKIEKTSADIDKKIHQLVRGIQTRIHDKKRNETQLLEQIRLQRILAPLKIIGKGLSIFGPKGAIIGAVVFGASNVLEHVLVNRRINEIANEFKAKYQLLNEQLSQLKIMLSKDNSSDFTEFGREIDKVSNEIGGELNESGTKLLATGGTGQWKEWRESLLKTLTTEEDKLKKQGRDPHTDSTIQLFVGMKETLQIAEFGVEVYKEICNDGEMVEKLSKLQEQFKTWDKYEQNIYNILIPQIHSIAETVKLLRSNSSSKSHVDLDVTKWEIQSTLASVKKNFQEMTRNLNAGGNLLDFIEKMTFGINILIDIYDRISDYSEKAKLATFIADLSLGLNYIKSPQLKTAMAQLQRMIQLNVAMEQYELAIEAVKYQKFPFADYYLGKYELPTSLNTSDSELIVNNIVEQITFIKTKIDESVASLNLIDTLLIRDVWFDTTRPFYKWKHSEHKNNTLKLLNGEEVTYKAEITDGLDLSAVKFNDIGIQFKLANQSLQNEWNNALHNFRIKMKMIGNSYYRCMQSIYQIPLTQNTTFLFLWRNGSQVEKNEMLRKINNNDYFLSPYVTWNIKLTGDVNKLKKFRNETMDVLLTGRGQYILNEEPFISKICSQHLDKYYTFHSRITIAKWRKLHSNFVKHPNDPKLFSAATNNKVAAARPNKILLRKPMNSQGKNI